MADFIGMVKYKDWNKGYNYLSFAVDTFSKTVRLRLLKVKSVQDV